MNYNKCEAFPLNYYTNAAHLGAALFIWKPNGMRYFGIHICSPFSKIFDLNGPNILKIIREVIRR